MSDLNEYGIRKAAAVLAEKLAPNGLIPIWYRETAEAVIEAYLSELPEPKTPSIRYPITLPHHSYKLEDEDE